MARGRYISETLGSSGKFLEITESGHPLADFCHALFPLLVVKADDFGYLEGDAKTIKMRVFPSSGHCVADFEDALLLLHDKGMIRLYLVQDKRYLHVLKFDEHQTGLHKRTQSRFPSYTSSEIPGNSRNFRQIPSEEKRREEKRTEEKKKRKNMSSSNGEFLPVVRDIFNYWTQVMQCPQAKLVTKREKAVMARLNDGYSADDIKTAIVGCHSSPFHMGDNGDGRVYNDLELICRSGVKLEQFMAIVQNGKNSSTATSGKPKTALRLQRGVQDTFLKTDEWRVRIQQMMDGFGEYERGELEGIELSAFGSYKEFREHLFEIRMPDEILQKLPPAV